LKFVSDIEMNPRGPWLFIDAESYTPPRRRDAYLRVLIEELDRVGVKQATVTVRYEDEEEPRAPAPNAMMRLQICSASPAFCAVARRVVWAWFGQSVRAKAMTRPPRAAPSDVPEPMHKRR
jgi:hypothetical protein